MANSRLCSIPDCGKPVRSKGWCNSHYLRHLIHGTPTGGSDYRNRDRGSVCQVDGCGKPAKARGWCGAHYRRWHKHGDPGESFPRGSSVGSPQRYFYEVVLAYEGDDCLPWTFGRSSDGYGRMRHGGKARNVHRVVCEEENGPPPSSKHDAAHSCGKGHEGCVAKRHLSWKTRSKNQMDRVAHGTSNRGEQCGAAKITEPQAREVLRLRGIATQREIAALFGVSQAAVYAIHARRNWAWL